MSSQIIARKLLENLTASITINNTQTITHLFEQSCQHIGPILHFVLSADPASASATFNDLGQIKHLASKQLGVSPDESVKCSAAKFLELIIICFSITKDNARVPFSLSNVPLNHHSLYPDFLQKESLTTLQQSLLPILYNSQTITPSLLFVILSCTRISLYSPLYQQHVLPAFLHFSSTIFLPLIPSISPRSLKNSVMHLIISGCLRILYTDPSSHVTDVILTIGKTFDQLQTFTNVLKHVQERKKEQRKDQPPVKQDREEEEEVVEEEIDLIDECFQRMIDLGDVIEREGITAVEIRRKLIGFYGPLMESSTRYLCTYLGINLHNSRELFSDLLTNFISLSKIKESAVLFETVIGKFISFHNNSVNDHQQAMLIDLILNLPLPWEYLNFVKIWH
ncbi:hypothetical protein GEMRC1_011447 [Eukaryota sp. GEM-RC1]